ncbi:MAG: hypothetical protein VXW87_04105 [Pseudomonadota bacterium]|nr:hypothetical protein [Pseudomonadota bacterium]
MMELDHDGIWAQLTIGLQIILYLSVKYVFKKLPILATAGFFFSTRTLYLLVGGLEDTQLKISESVLICGLYILILWALIFSSLDVVLAYAILAQLRLAQNEFRGPIWLSTQLMWPVSLLMVDLVPVMAVMVSFNITPQSYFLGDSEGRGYSKGGSLDNSVTKGKG